MPTSNIIECGAQIAFDVCVGVVFVVQGDSVRHGVELILVEYVVNVIFRSTWALNCNLWVEVATCDLLTAGRLLLYFLPLCHSFFLFRCLHLFL